MFRQLITLSLLSLLVACGQKNYPSPDQLTNQQIIDILVKEVGAEEVNDLKLETKSACIRKSGSKSERDSCANQSGTLYDKVLRENLIRKYNTYILNVTT
ncbi:MAG: hypothetical protein IJV56_06730 [Neisseriaceae bacterium]|nr:hypothetical protein [Neisseriaceae bacterium]